MGARKARASGFLACWYEAEPEDGRHRCRPRPGFTATVEDRKTHQPIPSLAPKTPAWIKSCSPWATWLRAWREPFVSLEGLALARASSSEQGAE